MDSVAEFYAGSEGIIREVDKFVKAHNLGGKIRADHICYKCGDSNSFLRIRNFFESGEESKWIYQSIISKRRIALIQSRHLFRTSIGDIDLVELSDQKPDKSQKEGFEHIEIYFTSGTYEGLVNYLEGKGLEVVKIERPHHTTHDIAIPGSYLVRLTRESLYDKVPREMVRIESN